MRAAYGYVSAEWRRLAGLWPIIDIAGGAIVSFGVVAILFWLALGLLNLAM